MKMQLVYTLSLVLILNCVIIIAKNDVDSEKKIDSKLNQIIYTEGSSVNQENHEEPKRRIYGRKGVLMNETIHDDMAKSQNVSQSSIESTTVLSTVHKNITTVTLSPTTASNNQSTNNTVESNSVNSTNLSSTVSNAPKLQPNTTIANPTKSLVKSTTVKSINTTTSTTTTTTTTTRKPKKPEVTYSADDNSDIRDTEKNVNYNIANEKSDELPKVEQDIDRTIIDEKRARNSYMLYLGLVFALPTSFVLINIAYRRIKNYLEMRHYTRVDFLVDGMYVS